MSKLVVNTYTKGYTALIVHMGVNLADCARRYTARNIGWPVRRNRYQ